MSEQLSTPVIYPVATVGGVSYSIRFGFRALYELNGRGINVAKLKEAIDAYTDKEQWPRAVFDLASAALGNQVNGKWHSQPMTPEQLCDTIQDAEYDKLSGALIEAFWGKRSLAAAVMAEAEASAPTDSTSSGGSIPGPLDVPLTASL